MTASHATIRQRVRRWLLSEHTYRNVRLELGLLPLRMNAAKVRARYRDARELLLNVGCGFRARPGFVNVDMGRQPGVDCVFDCRTSLPFPDGSVRGIFSEHYFEHLHYEQEAPLFVAECYRVLRPGGVLRLVVPDAGRYLHAYCSGGWNALSALRGLDAEHADPWLAQRYSTPMELINAVFRQNGEHLFAYDEVTLARVIERAGMRASVQQFGRGQLGDLLIDSRDRESESLYVEGVR